MCIFIIPIKHNSVRVPCKNFRDLNGKPLYYYIIDTVLKVKRLKKLVIDTNSPTVKEGINKHFNDSRIIIYDRPKHLESGDTPVNKLLKNVIESLNLESEYFIQTHTTNPLLKLETIENAIKTYTEVKKDGYDSLFTVKNYQTRLYKLQNESPVAINHNINELIPTQDLEMYYEENSCLYFFSKEILFKRNHRIGNKPYLFKMNDIESSDIDTENDWDIVKAIHKKYYLNNHNKNKYVLITGVNGGIGNKVAEKFSKEGWYVIGTGYFPNYKSKFIDRYIFANLSHKSAMENIIKDIIINENRIDCFVHCAAIQKCGPVWNLEENDWDMMYECNLKTIYKFVKYGIDIIKKNKTNLINIGSVHATNTSDEIAGYASTKAAVVGLTRNLGIELGKFGVRVNTISPGAVNTQMLKDGLSRGHVGDGSPEDLVSELGKKHLLGRVGEPDEISNLVYEVCNNQFINGANIVIDGGATIKLSTE